MAIIDRPNFALGNSNIGGAAAGVDFTFDRQGGDGIDPLYGPRMEYAEHIEIVPVGPNGEYGINVYPNSTNWDDTAFVRNDVGFTDGWVIPHAQYNYLRGRFELTTAGQTGAANFATLLQVGARNLNTSLLQPVLLYISGTTLTLEVYSFNSTTLTATYPIEVDGAFHHAEIRFHPGTPVIESGNWWDVQRNGWVQVYWDDQLVINLQAIDFYINEFDGTDNRFESYAVGHFGLYGRVYDVELGYPSHSARNFLTGYGHTVEGHDNVIAGRNGTLRQTERTVLLNLDGQAHEHSESGALILNGRFIHNGTELVSTATPEAAVVLVPSQLLALRATPITLVAAPGAGYLLEFVSAVLILDATATAYVETNDNLAIRYQNGTGPQASETIEMTGFIDQTTDRWIMAQPNASAALTKTATENQPLVLHNIGDSEFATGTGVLRVRISYRVWRTDW